jgi:hypothetical protein
VLLLADGHEIPPVPQFHSDTLPRLIQ